MFKNDVIKKIVEYKFNDTLIYDARNLKNVQCTCNRGGKTICDIKLDSISERFKRNSKYRSPMTSHRKTLYILLEKWLAEGRKVLDVGCAEGRIWDSIQVSLELHGLDQCSRRLGLYPYIGKDKPLGINKKFTSLTIFDINANNLPYKDNSFDICISLEVIEHILEVDSFLNEIYRVLSPGGRIILSTPNIAALKHRLGLLFGKALPFNFKFWKNGFYPLTKYEGKPYTSDGIRYPEQLQHIRFFTHESMEFIFKQTGFSKFKSFGISSWLNGRKASKEFGFISQFLATCKLKTVLPQMFCTAIKTF